jgi:hypothetical protein
VRINVEALREEKGATMALNMVEEFPPVDLTRSELVFVEPVRFAGQASNTGHRIVVTGEAYGRAIGIFLLTTLLRSLSAYVIIYLVRFRRYEEEFLWPKYAIYVAKAPLPGISAATQKSKPGADGIRTSTR